jgi:ankyrin repeat protein
LHVAARGGKKEMCSLLLDFGASKKIKNLKGLTAADVVTDPDNLDLIILLQQLEK